MEKQQKWTLTGEAFHKLLLSLDPDVQRAGEIYESIRLTLIKFFDWRGVHFPEDCADETFNRIMRKLEAGETIADVKTYCYGVARFVLLESLKKPDHKRADLDNLPPLMSPVQEEPPSNLRLECFTTCLQMLPTETKQLILQYYQDETRAKINNRALLADKLGIPLNALRSRAQRIRMKLEECINKCLNKKPRG
jgi:DNA-directed RNA polymerase specialized sigma24 family protein